MAESALRLQTNDFGCDATTVNDKYVVCYDPVIENAKVRVGTLSKTIMWQLAASTPV